MDGKEGTRSRSKANHLICGTRTCSAASETRSLGFIDEVTRDDSSRMNSELNRST